LFRGDVFEVIGDASSQEWLDEDAKPYRVIVTLDTKQPGLKFGMSGMVRFDADSQKKVLQVPAEAVLRSGRETFCYVKIDKELQERKVTIGARNDTNVEIKSGLHEGEKVLNSPADVAVRGQTKR
jgi:membrane fusion protein, copper/silver efflux system